VKVVQHLRRWRDDLVVVTATLLPLAIFIVRERQIAGAAGFPLDDSWIHLHFARNLAEGAGFSYNPGTPVAGSTAPLWTLLLAAGALMAGSSLAMAKALGVCVTAGAALVTRRAALAWGVRPEVALVAAVALLWTGALGWGALSGMEVSLAALLTAGALLAHARDHTLATAACAALAVLARPEAFLLLVLLVLARPLTIRRVVVFAVVTAGLLAPAIIFSLATVGAPYPATAAAKVEGGFVGWLGGINEPAALTWVRRPLAFLREWIVWLASTHWLLPVALCPALVLVWLRAGRALGLVALALLAHPLGMALLAPYRGPAFQEGRYSIHLLPLAALTLAVAAGTRPPRRDRARAHVLIAVLWLAVAAITLIPAATRYGWAVQNINAMQVHLGRWVDAHLPKTTPIAANDIGAIAYFSRREVIDLMGLVTPEIIPYRRQGEEGILRFVGEQCPDYVIVFPAWFPDMTARRYLLEPVFRVRLERNEVAGADEMVVYRLTRCAV